MPLFYTLRGISEQVALNYVRIVLKRKPCLRQPVKQMALEATVNIAK